MVTQKEKKQAISFITNLLEQSENYAILRKTENGVLVREKHAEEEDPRTIRIVLANALPTIDSFTDIHDFHRREGTYTAPVLYKDGKTAFVRMVDRNRSWRADKSLKNYSPQQINQMLHLRGIEKAIGQRFGNDLTYYQPETGNLEESVRTFHLHGVHLDYSHIDRDHQAYGFVGNRESIDYKLPQEIEVISGAAIIKFSEQQPDYYRRAWLSGLQL